MSQAGQRSDYFPQLGGLTSVPLPQPIYVPKIADPGGFIAQRLYPRFSPSGPRFNSWSYGKFLFNGAGKKKVDRGLKILIKPV